MQPIRFSILGLILMLFVSCGEQAPIESSTTGPESTELSALADEVRSETLRSWKAYKTYAWGHDVLAPISRTHRDWYSEPLYISPIDAYSTLVLMGFEEEASEVERYVVDSLSFDKDVDVKIFEVNIRILGGAFVHVQSLQESPGPRQSTRFCGSHAAGIQYANRNPKILGEFADGREPR